MRAIIVANGDLNITKDSLQLLVDSEITIAANGGIRHCQSLGLNPSVVIGDLDSITDSQRKAHKPEGTNFLVYPKDKDQTDLELALRYAKKIGAKEILLLGLFGGRLDQSLANILLLTREEWADLQFTVINGAETIYLLRENDVQTIDGNLGDIVSLISMTPSVSVIQTSGLRWPLMAVEIIFGTTLGVSNEMTEKSCQIEIGSGCLLIIHTKTGAQLWR